MTEPVFKNFYSDEKQEQTIRTPESIVKIVRELWGGCYDPCPASEGEAGPIGEISIPGPWIEAGSFGPVWLAPTYLNPPFAELKRWIEIARYHRARCSFSTMMLAPMRMHRTWFDQEYFDAPAKAHLKPVTFHGYKQTFPQPMVLLYYGSNPATFASLARPISVRVYGHQESL